MWIHLACWNCVFKVWILLCNIVRLIVIIPAHQLCETLDLLKFSLYTTEIYLFCCLIFSCLAFLLDLVFFALLDIIYLLYVLLLFISLFCIASAKYLHSFVRLAFIFESCSHSYMSVDFPLLYVLLLYVAGFFLIFL